MQLGFALFEELGKDFDVYEVFPSASYAMFAGDRAARVSMLLGGFAPGPKDMLDAYVAAATTREFVQGRGGEVGGGDGLGSIILPRPITKAIAGVLTWPTAAQSSDSSSESSDDSH
jgi:predicted nuclease with RNAse H fold